MGRDGVEVLPARGEEKKREREREKKGKKETRLFPCLATKEFHSIRADRSFEAECPGKRARSLSPSCALCVYTHDATTIVRRVYAPTAYTVRRTPYTVHRTPYTSDRQTHGGPRVGNIRALTRTLHTG